MQERIEQLEKAVARIEKKPKDGWDKMQVLFTLLTPITIGLVGFLFSNASERAQRAADTSKAAYEREQADLARKYQSERDHQEDKRNELQIRVTQAETLSHLTDALLSSDPKKRELGIQLLLIASPDGKNIVEAISKYDVDQTVKKFANDSLQQKREELVKMLFSESRPDRVRAYTLISQQWRTDPQILSQLLATAKNTGLENADGIYSFTSVLLDLSPDVLLPAKDEIFSFLNRIPKTGDWKQTLGKADEIKRLMERKSPK